VKELYKLILIAILSAAAISSVAARTGRGETRDDVDDIEDASDARPGELPTGVWGGEHIRLEVTEAGAQVEYDCAHGAIERKITTDRRGRFDVSGTHVEERGGPVRQGASRAAYAVRFTGRIDGKRMRLTIRRSDNKSLIGTFTLMHGQEAFLVKCR
jgi:hypothetical protein